MRVGRSTMQRLVAIVGVGGDECGWTVATGPCRDSPCRRSGKTDGFPTSFRDQPTGVNFHGGLFEAPLIMFRGVDRGVLRVAGGFKCTNAVIHHRR